MLSKTETYLVKPKVELSNFITAEVNLEKLPYFFADKNSKRDMSKLTYTYSKMFIDNKTEQAIEIIWKVMGTSEYGMPNCFDRDVYRALQKMITTKGVDSRGYVKFSMSEIISILGHKKSGYISSKIKESINRLTATTVKSKGTFYHKGEKEYISKTFHLFENLVERGKKLPDGSIADCFHLKMNELMLESIMSGYLKPLDVDYYFSLRNPTAKAIFSRLSVDFYGLPEKTPCLKKRYSALCAEIAITQQKYKSKARSYLKNSLEELLSTKFLKNVEFEDCVDDKHDFYIKFYPGKRIKEADKFKNLLSPNVIDFKPSIEPLTSPSKKLSNAKQSKVVEESIKAVEHQFSEEDQFLLKTLLNIGVSEVKAHECVKYNKESTKYWLEAKKHYNQNHDIKNWPAFLYRAITQNWTSVPYKEFLEKEKAKLKRLEQEKLRRQEELRRKQEELRRKEEEKKEFERLEKLYNSMSESQKDEIDKKTMEIFSQKHSVAHRALVKNGKTPLIEALLKSETHKLIAS